MKRIETETKVALADLATMLLDATNKTKSNNTTKTGCYRLIHQQDKNHTHKYHFTKLYI